MHVLYTISKVENGYIVLEGDRDVGYQRKEYVFATVDAMCKFFIKQAAKKVTKVKDKV